MRAALALAGVAVVLALGGCGGGARRAVVATALRAPTGTAVVIGAHPIGLSVEYPLLERWLGSRPCPPAALVAALRRLGNPTLRIGGDSQDEVAPAGTPPFPGVRDLDAALWRQLGCLEREIAIPVVVGLNLASGQPRWAGELARAARAAIPAGALSFELGNEPDLYGSTVSWWNGRTLESAPMGWGTYLARARAVARAVGATAALEGPDLASGRWVRRVPALAAALHLRTLDAHFYPLDGCRGRPPDAIASLLSAAIQTKLDERVRLARDARTLGLEAVVSEAGSVSCGGIAGVSDTPASAVWGARTVLSALRDGFASVRFHSSGGAYDPLVVTADTVVARPLYRALAALAPLLAAGARLQALASAPGLAAVALTRADGTRTTLVSNYTPAARWVSVAATGAVSAVAIRARTPVVSESRVAPSRGRALVELPGDSLVALTSAR